MAKNQNNPGAGATGEWTDPYTSFHFAIDINGVTEARFVECSSISVDVEAIRYRQAGAHEIVHRLPGRVEYSDLTLRYGMTSSTQLWEWMESSIAGNVDRRHVSVILYGHDGATEVTRWNLRNAWPRSWRGTPLDALGNQVAVESLVLVFEEFERVVAAGGGG
ncbi:phage tail protein [Ectothiorhodospira lacustris]|uniref:phage tail protein n=1 Tax=Ectothiorhodospira lacustris TaxID=2899127 RepID=UPI001EE96868|nr:phage tail protein [Ectothiorhodospira lacustris]MCG5501141.1 phage tail protein [Ectothiorhodospira lacustris]MCG5511217.1 phage tail protein [Ectothiorhodospira lacustris]MCG5522967.1 phage tail protein [Ectothiorhodospira lacustris]